MTTKNTNIENMKVEHDAAHSASAAANGISSLSRAREEMYFRNKDAELLKNFGRKDKKSNGKNK